MKSRISCQLNRHSGAFVINQTRISDHFLQDSTLNSLQKFRIQHGGLDIPEDEDDIGCEGYGVVKMADLDRGDGVEPLAVAVRQVRSSIDRSECIGNLIYELL